MGYYTTFKIEASESKIMEEFLAKDVRSYGEIFEAIFDEDGDSHDSYKWYDHESDMKEVSKEFPNVLFTLKGEGEEAGDIWIKYFKNGKMQSCPAKLVFDEYDESKLR